MTLSDLDTLTATVGQMTPEPMTVMQNGDGWYQAVGEEFMNHMGAQQETDAYNKLKSAAPALLHAARTLEKIRKLRDSFAVYVQSQFPSGEDQNPPCASFSSDTSDDDMCKHCGWTEQSHYDYAILSELLALLDAAPAQEK